MSVGYDHIDLNTAREENVKIGYTPDVLTDTTADLTVLLTLAAARRMRSGVRACETGEVDVNDLDIYFIGFL
jgi:glyoxylate/hydroxypyruvate reductase